MAGVSPQRPVVLPHLVIDPEIDDKEYLAQVIKELKDGKIRLERTEREAPAADPTTTPGADQAVVEKDISDSFSFTGTPASLHQFRTTSMYCIPVYPEGSRYFEDFGDYVSDYWFPMLSSELFFIGGKEGFKTGVISHSANLKPQPIFKPREGKLGFKDGMLVTLLFGAVPKDFPIWLRSTVQIVEDFKTDHMWELSYYDANEYLNTLGNYCGYEEWVSGKENTGGRGGGLLGLDTEPLI
jgi:hypothetical protein